MDVTEVEGRDAVLTCIASGFPAPAITWYRGAVENNNMELNGTLQPVATVDGYFVVTSKLTISPINRHDSDLYSCVASNEILGSTRIEMRDFNVSVNCKCKLS